MYHTSLNSAWSPAQTNSHRVHVESTGRSFSCKPDESVYEAMRRSMGLVSAYGCFGGGCGACKMRVLQGKYTIFKRMSRAHITPAEEEKGILLMCCVRPLEDLVVTQIES